ncbi:hypothetical protein ASPSYDRAFT_86626 [Aspergillus sydowii CBS 593.65]|uniref:SCP domain-containing protein n=1 Tax=Aspergillus sydowii CBS 593.65 TaxID=1036612 RepID=A0A1L9TU61_9EURO|nr:uncharacterized protein ASPSYDRAFT_86626 [Aspergillus sydowii CBS 593.65]OJJ62977.1 hypothetical protein ASPSYDRAFT_86626 [Aspergillus sydowii CBS 593.65]
MQFLTSILLLASLALTVSAAPAVDTPDIEAPDAIGPSSSPSGTRDIAFNDADAEIYARLRAATHNTTVEQGAKANPTFKGLTSIDNYFLECSKYWPARRYRINDGITYLDGLEHTPKIGPWRCSRVSCSYRSAIHWCNDNPDEPMELPSFSVIADNAEYILEECSNFSGEVSGTVYHDDRWRVVVKKTGDVEGDPDC